MSIKKNRRRPLAAPTPFEEARDELFQHIMRCGVIGSAEEHQTEWFGDTMTYMKERYPELDDARLEELKTLGERFCRPAKAQQVETADAASAA
jgi:hypothetical protein